MKINNRRYIGCKTKLLDFIYNSTIELGFDNTYSFADLFAGTGTVGSFFAEKGYNVLLNDNLYSNAISYEAFLGNDSINADLINQEINYFNSIDPTKIDDNYFSKVYGNKYYSNEDAKVIGFIRDYIEDNKEKYNKREYAILVTSLLYCADKIANTVGHFESYLNRDNIPNRGIKLNSLDLFDKISKIEIMNEDTNKIADKINYDICYIDPPYNARQYVNFYHVLENLARWNKPVEFEGNTMKFKRNELKSGYSRSQAPILFEDLIKKLNCKLIIVSYNNTYNAKSGASNNKISEEEIITILNKKGEVNVKEIDYSYFNAGKTNFSNHKELLYICLVKDNN